MRRIGLKATFCLALAAVSVAVHARELVMKGGKTNNSKPAASFKTEAGDCATPTAQFDLDINNVRARLLTGGDMWWNLSDARYQVPKGDQNSASLNAIFSGTIWISGEDAGQNLKVAAQRYRGSGDDFWPGPVVNGVIDRATCNKYDRFFNVYGNDITLAQSAFLQKGAGTTLADIPRGLLSWPAKGNQYLATDPSLLGETFLINDNMAPFKDVDGDGLYDPIKGDYPYIPCRRNPESAEAYGDQMVFWVINDVGNQHTESNGVAIGVQVNCLAFAFQTTNDINNMTFYKYEIINKSANPLYKAYISQNVDPDLGCFNDDAIGCDTSRSLGIVYNRNAIDIDCQGVSGYGSQLPLLGVDFFEGPIGDNNQELGISSFIYYTNGGTVDNDPLTAKQYRNYQEGRFSDGTPITIGGTGIGSGGPVTNFVYPSNPVDPNGWSEVTVPTQAGDRRFVQTTGPFTLNTGVSQYVTIGVVFVRPAGGVGVPPNFETAIGPADDLAQALFNQCFVLTDGPQAPDLSIRELSNRLIINLENKPGSNNFGESYDQVDGSVATEINTKFGGQGDSTYTFEGYKLYQVSNPAVSATDLDDPSKARQIAIVDVKNGITNIINYEKDATLGGLLVPYLKAQGNDAGITTSFNITEDLFASGDDKRLVNQRTYYFTAVAYAHNDYKTFEQENPSAGGQLTPYLQGRKNFKVYSAVPHQTNPRNGGTVLNAEWGEGVEVKRIEGSGNGGNVLNLNAETIAKILGSGSYAMADTLTYVKGSDPIGFRVTDPVSLKEADWELQVDVDTFYNVPVQYTSNGQTVNVYINDVREDTAFAPLILRDIVAGSTDYPPMDDPQSFISFSPELLRNRTGWHLINLTDNITINSERRDLDRPYEQQIATADENYGFVLKLGNPVPRSIIPGSYLGSQGAPNRNVYDVSQSSITYQNNLDRWLSFVKDEGTTSVTNWIRSGTTAYDPAAQSNVSKAASQAFDDNFYYTDLTSPANAYDATKTRFTDSLEIFESILEGTWAPYCLATNYAKVNLTTDERDAGKPPYVHGPGFKWRNYGNAVPTPQNTLDRLASVDIVITPDKSKWSRCIVFETGEDENVNQGALLAPNGKNARKGQIRMQTAKRWHDPVSRDYLEDDNTDIGRSWFPGYAINVETGERLNIAFGESSDMGDQNGRDMLWNPTSVMYSPIVKPGQIITQDPYFGGKHFIYVLESKYDECNAAYQLLWDNYDKIGAASPFNIPNDLQPLYRSIMWTSMPYLTQGYSLAADQNGVKYIPPSEITVKLRVEKPYDPFVTSATTADAAPRYQFSTVGMGATEENEEVAKNALDEIRIVPNPYLAYSEYETDQNSNRVKITNLPNKCTVTIYALDGTLIRRLSRAIDVDPSTNKKIEISDGLTVDQINVDNSLDWDLKNDKNITISSGIYLFHVEAPNIGQRTLKWFGALRPADASNF